MAHFSVLHFHAYSLKIKGGRAYNELIYISLVMNTPLYVEILGQSVVERTPYYFGQIDPRKLSEGQHSVGWDEDDQNADPLTYAITL